MYNEAELLRQRGHKVKIYERTNAELTGRGRWATARAIWRGAWSEESCCEIGRVMDDFRPDVLHVHNYKWLLTPSIFSAARQRGVGSVITLHNYRLACPAGQFLSRGRVCERCLTRPPWFCLLRRCANTFATTCIQWHLYQGTRRSLRQGPLADAFVALSNFACEKFIQAGLPSTRLHVKPNTMPDPLAGAAATQPGAGVLFVGRLSHEKGLLTLLEAWKGLKDWPLTLVGDGPLRSRLEAMTGQGVTMLGHRDHKEVINLLQACRLVVFPSECYEGFPGVILEAMAMGRAVVASDLGARSEMIENGRSGLLFRAGDAADLQRAVRQALQNPDYIATMSSQARELFLKRYHPDDNMRQLEAIYSAVARKPLFTTLTEPTP